MKKIFLRNIMKFALLLPLLAINACGDFDDTNIDPNRPTFVPTAGLLTAAMRPLGNTSYSFQGTLYSQHIAETQYTTSSRYEQVRFDFNGFYDGVLTDLQEVIRLNTDPETSGRAAESGSNNNQIAIARILKAYYFHIATDRWGDLPYSEALKGTENLTPSYDTQEFIYRDLFNELKEAVSQIDNGLAVSGDIVFAGDMSAWTKFANSLRMIMALRLSEADASLAQSEFNGALNAGVIDSNADNVVYQYLAEATNQNIWFEEFLTRVDYAVSNTMIDHLKNSNDPRLPAYADPNINGEYVGRQYGVSASEPFDQVSLPSTGTIRRQDAPAYVLTHAQILFSKAEAAQRGWISGSAEDFYNDAIRASMEQWGVFDQAAYDAFIAQPEIAFDSGTALEQIGTQKWVALYLQGYEAWFEWRRTGFPDLQPAQDALNNSGNIPVRQGYPASERDINSVNYLDAVSRFGGEEMDGLDTSVWWDK
ncbi:SusD/RagB family nutrient-binding outer membrane lipoprotein [Fulvivirgaceae bacterium BMA10]|uniref:SusD/RagB family nutrient-binding outer membrane lipoprotein n=1 Tax=Splendidivirga corallicola TaxID=3051826 RepID=A0ABT8KI16_9BACT|nr:SusD/RagB family nutrient-binding outer membrane lipoprotein [Fulvivirgaceae bacterium BMA10]